MFNEVQRKIISVAMCCVISLATTGISQQQMNMQASGIHNTAQEAFEMYDSVLGCDTPLFAPLF
jgi:hypothetical protein